MLTSRHANQISSPTSSIFHVIIFVLAYFSDKQYSFMFSNGRASNYSLGSIVADNCGIGKFSCIEGCCLDFTYLIIVLIVIAMIATVGIFIHIEMKKERRFNTKLLQHIELMNKEGTSAIFDETHIFLRRASPIDSCSFNLPPSCSPPMTVPKLKFHKNRPIRHFISKHL